MGLKYPIDRDAPASVIAERFDGRHGNGGPSGLANAINRPTSTVNRWLVKGYIPSDYWPEIMAAGEARKLKPPIRETDFAARRKPAKSLAQA